MRENTGKWGKIEEILANIPILPTRELEAGYGPERANLM